MKSETLLLLCIAAFAVAWGLALIGTILFP